MERLPSAFAVPGSVLAVFVSGVSSMGLEILAGRIVVPQFGSSIFTWGTIIGVFLTALSLGYYLGGQRAAREADTERLVRLLLGSAAYLALVVFAHDYLLRVAAAIPLPGRFASLPAVVLLFGPPTYLLGFISPYAAELSRKDSVGAASGHVYAVGTIGSIIGAFGTTFLLIPFLPVEQIGLVLGLLLVGTALWLSRGNLWGRIPTMSVFVGLLLVLAAVSAPIGVSTGGHVIHRTQTPYQQLEVTQFGETRTLYLDGQRHSAMDMDDPDRNVFTYTRYFHLPFLFTDDIDRVLFIGGGGFTGPKHFVRHYNVTVDVAEIDPVVIDVAKRYFGVTESPRLRIHSVDGRRFLRETNHTYDLIVLDAYKKDKVPFQLTTEEFMRLAASRLSADGILYSNLISAPSGPASRFYRAEYKTMSQVFPRVYSFPTSDLGAVQNIELVATKNPALVTQSELRTRYERRDMPVVLEDAIARYRRDVPVDGVPVLRDDRAPVDTLIDPMVGRRYVIEQSATGNRTRVAASPNRLYG